MRQRGSECALTVSLCFMERGNQRPDPPLVRACSIFRRTAMPFPAQSRFGPSHDPLARQPNLLWTAHDCSLLSLQTDRRSSVPSQAALRQTEAQWTVVDFGISLQLFRPLEHCRVHTSPGSPRTSRPTP